MFTGSRHDMDMERVRHVDVVQHADSIDLRLLGIHTVRTLRGQPQLAMETTQPPNGSDRASRLARFTSLLAHPFNRRSEPVDTAQKPAEIDPLTLALAEWAGSRAARDHFIPFLDSLITSADDAISANLASHPHQAYATGYRDAFRNLRTLFQSWAGPSD